MPDYKPIISCAVTGSGDTVGKHPDIPVTPEQIATAAIESAKAGAAIAHMHVREPDSGKPSRRLDLYREVVDRIRESDTDVIINLTTGMGGDLYMGPDDDPLRFTDETDCVGQMERIEHIEALLPDICSLDCGSFNYMGRNYVYISTQEMLEMGARRIQELGVKPELEVFDLGQIWFAKHLISKGHLSNGRELGPTTPADLEPGEKRDVTLTAESDDFDGWSAHPEVGSGEHGHGEGGEHDREEEIGRAHV
jgi:uncharacterized protein (DUF849 family)